MKIVGMMVCGPGEADRYLRETLEEFKRLCDDAVVAMCNTTEKERKMVMAYGFRQYEDNRVWGKQQPNIKTDLLKRIVKLNPDWILALDADETVPTVTREILEQMTVNREVAQFYVVNLWRDVNHYRRDMGFFNVRFYKHIPGMETQFLRKNVHCGLAPPYFYAIPPKDSYVQHILLHKGLMDQGNRERKIIRYQEFDPNAVFKGQAYYDALAQDWATGTEYSQEKVINHLFDELKRYGCKP